MSWKMDGEACPADGLETCSFKTGIMVGPAAQWNCQFRHRFVHVLARSSLASRLLGAAVACVILLSFAVGYRKSYSSGRTKAAVVICQQVFSILVLAFFLLKCSLESASKSPFPFSLWRRDSSGFGAAISDAVSRSSIALCNSACADRIVMAASRLLGVAAAHVILLSFAAGHPKSYGSGCTICQQIFEV